MHPSWIAPIFIACVLYHRKLVPSLFFLFPFSFAAGATRQGSPSQHCDYRRGLLGKASVFAFPVGRGTPGAWNVARVAARARRSYRQLPPATALRQASRKGKGRGSARARQSERRSEDQRVAALPAAKAPAPPVAASSDGEGRVAVQGGWRGAAMALLCREAHRRIFFSYGCEAVDLRS